MIPILASTILLIAHSQWQGVSLLSQTLSQIVLPIQKTVDMPSYVVEQTEVFFKERLNLLTENASLKQQQIYLQAQVQKLRALEAENLELRELLSSIGQEKESFSEARIIQANLDPFRQQILLNKGKLQGVELGQPVIDAKGLVGVILSATDTSSHVLLLTDTGFAVPVQSVRSGERAIAVGSGTGGELRLNYVPRTADFMEGDELVTSGLGGRFPAGYPVGVITSIQHDPSTRFTLIGVSPSAKLGQFRHVLLVKQHAPEHLIGKNHTKKNTLSKKRIDVKSVSAVPEIYPISQIGKGV